MRYRCHAELERFRADQVVRDPCFNLSVLRVRLVRLASDFVNRKRYDESRASGVPEQRTH